MLLSLPSSCASESSFGVAVVAGFPYCDAPPPSSISPGVVQFETILLRFFLIALTLEI